MTKTFGHLEELEEVRLIPASEADKKEIEKCFESEIEVSYDTELLRVYTENGIYIADLVEHR